MVARLYLGGSQVGTDITMTEVSGQGGLYAGNMPNGLASAIYVVQFLISSVIKGAGTIVWDGVHEVTFLDVTPPLPPLQVC